MYNMCTTWADPEGGGGGQGVRTPPPPGIARFLVFAMLEFSVRLLLGILNPLPPPPPPPQKIFLIRACGPGPTQTRLFSHRNWLEAANFGFRNKRNCTFRVANTKALISFAVTAKLICAFGFAYANCWFSHEMAQITRE